MELTKTYQDGTVRAALKRFFTEEGEWHEVFVLNDGPVEHDRVGHMLLFQHLPQEHPLNHQDFSAAISNALDVMQAENIPAPAQQIVGGVVIVPHRDVRKVEKMLDHVLRFVAPQGQDMEDVVDCNMLAQSWKTAVTKNIREGYDAIKLVMHANLRAQIASELDNLSISSPLWPDNASKFKDQAISTMFCSPLKWEAMDDAMDLKLYHPYTQKAIHTMETHLQRHYGDCGHEFIVSERNLPAMSPAQMQQWEEDLRTIITQGKSLLKEDPAFCRSVVRDSNHNKHDQSNLFVASVQATPDASRTIVSLVLHEITQKTAVAHLLRKEKLAQSFSSRHNEEGRAL